MTSSPAASLTDRRKRANRRTVLFLWAVPAAFLLVFFFSPLAAVFSTAAKTALSDGLGVDLWQRIWRPLRFTFFQAGLSTLLTLLLGLPAAYVFARFTFPGKKLLRVLATLPFILPTVVAAAGFNAFLGPRGLVNVALMRWLDLAAPPVAFMNTLTAILVAHVFYNVSVVIRVVGSAWAQMNTRQEQVARVLGASAWRTLWEVTLPLLKNAIFGAALLVFLFDFTSFGVILMLGGPKFATLEVEIYLQAMHMLNLPAAGLLSAIQLGVTLILTVASSRLHTQRDTKMMPLLHNEAVRRPQSRGEKWLVGGIALILILLLVLPTGSLALRSVTRLDAARGERGAVAAALTLDYYRELFTNRQGSLFYVPPIAAARNSLLYAGATVMISLVLGLLVTYALARRSRVNRVLEPLLMLPLGASAVTLGLGFILAFNRPPLQLLSSPVLVPIAHSLVALPFVVRTLQPALVSIPDSLRQAAASMGASPWQVWREVDFPIMTRAALVSAIFAFTISLGEFGATSFLSRPEYPTLPVAIFRFLSQPGALNYGQALAMSTLLMLVCGGSILLLEQLRLPGVGIEL
ncbi:MAG: iron ABC transporter permease [Anaerolineaceae bacterium]|nr:iron ABC transporter permease [Anaerolineaceae bacterium]